MSVETLRQRLERHGVRLSRDGSEIVVDAPDGVLTADLISEIRAAKEHLLDRLDQPDTLEQADLLPDLSRAEDRSHLPLSFSQQRLWYLDQIEPGQPTYNLPFAYDIDGELDSSALERALNIIANRHEILRTTFSSRDGIPFQKVHDNACLELERLPYAQDSSNEGELDNLLISFAMQLFDLQNGPLVRAALAEVGPSRWAFIVVAHHTIFDGTSVQVFEKELKAAYTAIVSNSEIGLEDLPVQFGDFAKWQADWLDERTIRKYLGYWIPKLGSDITPTELSLDFPRPAEQTYNGSRVINKIGRHALTELKQFANECHTTVFVVLMAAFVATLHIVCRKKDVTVGFPIAARPFTETENLIGFFANTLPLRTRIDANATFADLIRTIRNSVIEALNWSELPFEKLVEEINPPRDLSRSPIFQIFLSYLETGNPGFAIGSVRFHRRRIAMPVSRVDASLFATESDHGMILVFEYNVDLLERATALRISDLLSSVLKQVIEDPNVSLCTLRTVPEQDEQLLTTEWNATRCALPRGSPFDQLLNHSVDDPDRPAIEFEGVETSYGSLQHQANQLANFLHATGVDPGSMVGIHMDRSADMLVAILGVINAGCAYLPLDPGFPAQRLEFMLADSGTQVLITQESQLKSLPGFAGHTIAVDRDSDAIGACPSSTPELDLDLQALAYVLYTSGSTGSPKGVMVPHSCVANFLSSMAREPGLSADDSLLAVTTTSFDISVLELFLPLTVGAKVIIASSEDAADGAKLKLLLEHSDATVMQATPTTWRMLLDAGWGGGQNFKVLCGGEPLPQELARELIPVCGEVWNLYGPTEATIWSSCTRITDADSPITIGRPIANTQIYVLDDNQQLQPIGVSGELCIAGAGVSLGYINQPELTSAAFIPNPFSDEPGARLYRTGDLARWRSDGTLQHLGRIDGQVKIRGYRIELGEIESILSDHDSVKAVACNVWHAAANDQRLVAHIVPADKQLLASTELRKHLRGKVPDYMVPQYFEQIASIPLTANGKVDRNALPSPAQSSAKQHTYEPPQTETERVIAAIWQDIVGVEKVGRHDFFFDIGGHSLLAVRAAAAMEVQLHGRPNLRDIILEDLSQNAVRYQPQETKAPDLEKNRRNIVSMLFGR